MTVYRIKDWAKHFENNRTKELIRMSWVPMPNKMDGDGYTQLLDDRNGAAHFGGWCAIVEIASKCEPRGTLLRPNPASNSGFSPHTPSSLSRISRVPEKVFSEVIPRLVTIGWIELIEIPQEGAAQPQEAAPSRVRASARLGMEWNGMERKDSMSAGADATDSKSTFPPDFIQFWSLYPRKGRNSRKDALAIWRRKKIEERADTINSSLALWIESKRWDEGFICNATTWLNQERWTEQPEPKATESESGFVGNQYKSVAEMDLPTRAELARMQRGDK